MSLTHRMSELEHNPFGLSAAGHRCFHCGEFVQDPGVMWSGNDGQTIYLHGECVYRWLPGLLRDAAELRYAGKPCSNQLRKEPRSRVA